MGLALETKRSRLGIRSGQHHCLDQATDGSGQRDLESRGQLLDYRVADQADGMVRLETRQGEKRPSRYLLRSYAS